MELEDLTQLINHYLTEMAQIALTYGATADKYVGDAIMIFFGDPQTRGVKEDARACVEMAIAMQRRMDELGAIWRDAGIEHPLRCRIGIHTGYCTVGNFGSEDRMDYTIIGGPVNLASRLEHEAPIEVDFPASPTDDAVISVYGSLDGTAWSATPLMVLVLDKDVDPNSIDFIVTGVYQFRVGVKRSGSTGTLTSADLAFRKDGVSV